MLVAPLNYTKSLAQNTELERVRAELLVDPARALLAASEESRRLERLNTNAKLQLEYDAIRVQALLRLRQTERALNLAKQALAKVGTQKDLMRLKADLQLSLGQIYYRGNAVEKALPMLQSSFANYGLVNDRRGQSAALQSLGILYNMGNDQRSALKFNSQAIEIFRDDPKLLMAAYNNVGNALLVLAKDRNKELARKAEDNLRRALSIAERLQSVRHLYVITGNIAEALILQKKFEEADSIVTDLLRRSTSTEVKGELWQLYQVRARVALLRGELPAASRLIAATFAHIDPTATPTNVRRAHETAYDVYRATGRTRKALEQLETIVRIDKETTALTTSTAAALMAARFNAANQDLRIAQLKAEQAESTARSQRTILIVAGTGGTLIVVLLAIGLVLITRSRNREREANVVLERTNLELARANAAKMEFLATTSHEIRTPLNGILGMAQVMLADSRIDATMRDRIGVMQSAGTTMRALVDDILDMAKIETGNVTVESGVVDLRALLVDVAKVWRLQAEAGKIELRLELDACPHRIMGDAGRIRQIVYNLLSNAMKFTEQGMVTLRVEIERDARLSISVKDTGIGIAKQWHDAIFDLFQQVDGGTTRRYGGTGLGLAICRSLARAMGGDVVLISEPGFGSTFTLQLPFTPVELPVLEAQRALRAGILVIEANPLTLGLLKASLAPHFDDIQSAATCEAGLDLVEGQGFAWIVVDATLFAATPPAVRNGLATCGARLVIIGDGDDVPSGVTVLSKPLSRTALVRALTEAKPQAALAQAAA